MTSYSVVMSEYGTYKPAKDESKGKGKKKVQNSDSDDDSGSDDLPKRPAPKRGKAKDALFRLKWWRIVLGA